MAAAERVRAKARTADDAYVDSAAGHPTFDSMVPHRTPLPGANFISGRVRYVAQDVVLTLEESQCTVCLKPFGTSSRS